MRGFGFGRGRSARTIAVVLACALALALAPTSSFAEGTGGDNDGGKQESELHQAREELRQTKDRMRERAKKIRAVKRDLNRLATEISLNQSQIDDAEERMGKLSSSIAELEVHMAELQGRLDLRNRQAFIQGPGAPVLYLLTATSAGEAADRLSMITEMNRRDEVLAARVQEVAERLSRGRAEFLRLQRTRQLSIQQLAVKRVELRQRFADSRALFAKLEQHKQEVLDVIAKWRPFQVCPVDGPVAIADDFGIWVHRPKKWGGDHVHQGNDMMAPEGTPIVAPFDGVAVNARNHIGGLAVKVYGEYGYVYNAHLSAYGQLGPVEAGDVIGYVGHTGDTGANHDHFEWHPDDGPAVDPNPFLLKVC
jgi:murein DD-endopeptidase MepM/ murein hydrolase activator NlpD